MKWVQIQGNTVNDISSEDTFCSIVNMTYITDVSIVNSDTNPDTHEIIAYDTAACKYTFYTSDSKEDVEEKYADFIGFLTDASRMFYDFGKTIVDGQFTGRFKQLLEQGQVQVQSEKSGTLSASDIAMQEMREIYYKNEGKRP